MQRSKTPTNESFIYLQAAYESGQICGFGL
jgi:hypothetical protein